MRTARVLILLLTLVSWPRIAAAEGDTWKAERLWVVGSDEQAWVVGAAKPEDKQPAVVRMWHLGPKGNPTGAVPKPSRRLPPISANIVRVGADSEALRVLLSNSATWHYFPNRPALAGDLWKSHCRQPPLAWGGDATKPMLWALARTADLITPPAAASSQPTTAATQEPDTQPADLSDAPPVDENSLTLMQLRGGFWHRFDVLHAAEKGDTFWLAGRDGDVFLFWQGERRPVRLSRRRGDEWSPPETVVDARDVVTAWAGATKQGPVFVAGRGASAQAVQLSVYLRTSDEWSTSGPARAGNDFLSINANETGVGVVRGRLAVARNNSDGKVEFAWGDLRASPLLQFETLSMRVEEGAPEPSWWDAVLTALVLSVVTFVMFQRRDQINRPASVSRGFVIAEPWRRVLATAIDIVPAMLVIMPWSMSMFPTDDMSVLFELAQDPDFVAKFVPINLAFVALYGLWCFIWEMTTYTTPGKRLFSCRVLSTNGSPPTTRQILVRNLCRVITFAIGMPTLMVALLLMLVLTRNRQRIGDLMAETVVVQYGVGPEPPVARPLDPDEHNDTDA